MKKFETNYPVEGTSALQPTFDSASTRHARIIAFPGYRGGQDVCTARFPQHAYCPQTRRAGSDFVSAVRSGNAQGLAFGRIRRWQAVVVGFVFAALSLVGLFAGL